jgi:TolB-like protein/AraC-like DNA-binding protein
METQPSMGDQFLTLVKQILEENIGNEDFTVSSLAKEVGLSRSMLHRKLIQFTGKSATTLITEIRLKRAWELLESDVATVSEIAYKVGFKSPSYFHRVFKKTYQIPPGEVRKKGIGKRSSILNSAKKKRMTWKIVSILSFVAIVIMTALLIQQNTNKKMGSAVREKSIAVLLFQNFSGDPEQDFIGRSLTGEIINHLYGIKSFNRIVSLTSIMTYQEQNKNISQIADELRVNYILEGSYKRSGTNIRVTAQLIDARNDNPIWQKIYNESYTELVTIEAEIALQIAKHLHAFITRSEKQRIEAIPTNIQEAYELVQKALYLSYSDTGDIQDTKIEAELLAMAKNAIMLDPSYADAHAFAGTYFIMNGIWRSHTDMRLATWNALPSFEQALTLDPSNVQALGGMGVLNHLVRWDYLEAQNYYLRAINESPHNPIVIGAYLLFLNQMGRSDEAMSLLEGYDYDLFEWRIKTLILAGYSEEAFNKVQNWVSTIGEPDYGIIAEVCTWLNEYDTARFYLEEALQARDTLMKTPRFRANLACVYHETTDNNKSDSIILQLKKQSEISSAGSPEFFVAWYYSRIAQADSAFLWLEKAYEIQSPEIPWLKVDPSFESLKGDERYWDLYERTGHKAYDDYMASKKD